MRQDKFTVNNLGRDDKLKEKQEMSPCSHYPVNCLISSRWQLVEAETSSLSRQWPADHYYKDPISKVKLQGVDSIEPHPHEHSQPQQTIEIHNFSRHDPQKKHPQVHLHEAQSCKAGDDS